MGTRYTHEKDGSREATQQIPALPKAPAQPPAGMTILLVVRVSIFASFNFLNIVIPLQPVHWFRRDKPQRDHYVGICEVAEREHGTLSKLTQLGKIGG